MTWLIVLVGACLGLVVYAYLLYPLILFLAAGWVQLVRDIRFVWTKSQRRSLSQVELPHVGVVIAAYNEERHMAARITNLLSLDYPVERLHCYIGSDGSQDGTAEVLRSITDPRIQTFVFERNRGKASVLNDLVERVEQPIVVFSDANTFFDAQALRRLVEPFADAAVGGVSGELRLLGSHGTNQDSLYWKVEQCLKFFEARIGGLLGANGAIYAIRRSLWKPLAPDTICDDFCVGMTVAASGRRLAYAPQAWAEEETPPDISDEYGRRVRIGIGNFQALFRHPDYLLRTSMGTRFAYLSHKVLRWLAPHLLLVALCGSFVLAGLGVSVGWLWFALAQLSAYLGCAGLYALLQRGSRLPGWLRIPVFLYALNWAFLVASWRYATGQYSGSWRRTAR